MDPWMKKLAERSSNNNPTANNLGLPGGMVNQDVMTPYTRVMVARMMDKIKNKRTIGAAETEIQNLRSDQENPFENNNLSR